MAERQPFRPFHSATSGDDWFGFNCWECGRYNANSEAAYRGCAAEMHLTLHAILGDGEWPNPRTLDFIGIKEGEDGRPVMPRLCANYRDPNEPRPKRIKVIPGQQSLFA